MTPAQSQEVALRGATQSAIEQFRDDQFISEIETATPEGVSARQLLRAAMTAVLETPELAQPGLRASLLQATLKAAQDGLLPDGREAAFIIFGGKEKGVVYMPMIGGFRKIAADHGWDLRADLVYANDDWDFESGYDPKLYHRPTRPGQERGELIAAYAFGQHRDGRKTKPVVLDRDDIAKIKKASRASSRGPWVDWEDRMWLKSAGRRAFKELPLDPNDKRIGRVLAFDEDTPQDAIDALYGPAGDRIIEHRSAPAGVSSLPAATDKAGEDVSDSADSPAGLVNEETGEVIVEPTAEELDAMAANEANNAEGEEVEWQAATFPSGMFQGQTIQEIWDSGGRGRGYLKWAATDWGDEELRTQVQAALEVLDS